MTRHRASKVNRRIRTIRARNRDRVIGLGAAAGALLTFGATPLLMPPAVRADVADDVIDQFFSPFVDAATNTLDWDAMASPTAWAAFFDPAHWDAVLAELNASGADAGAAIAASSVYTPLHAEIEKWIDSDLGKQVDGVINKTFGSYVIGDGKSGTEGHPDGGAGGWLFGDGGAGWDSTSAGVAGGNGGHAGAFGDGGAGGDGGSGVGGGAGGSGGSLMGIGGVGGNGGAGESGVVNGVGGAGGAGGAAPGWLFGVGGHGGNGGDGAAGGVGGAGGDGGRATGPLGDGGNGGNAGDSGANTTALPALGGAGGNGGPLGVHGAVGSYGTAVGGTQTAPAVGDGPELTPINPTGGWLTDSDGKVFIPHGVIQAYKLPPYTPSADGFGDDDAAFLAANGIDVVRLGIFWSGVEPEPGVFNDAYLASIAQTIQTLADHGIRVTLDMHQDAYGPTFAGDGAPEWATQTGGLPNLDMLGQLPNEFLNPAENHAWDAFWANEQGPNGAGLENEFAQMWQHVAGYFHNSDVKSDIVGYKILNEPIPGSQSIATLFGDPHFDAQELTPMYNQVDAAIRSVDPTTPVMFEPNVLADVGVPTHLGTVNDPNTIYGFHTGCIVALLGAGSACGGEADKAMDNAEAYASAHHIPTYDTAIIPEGKSDQLGVLADIVQTAEQHELGWNVWTYTGGGNITADINTGGSDTLSQQLALVDDPSKPPVGDNVNTDMLKVLAQPYPQTVAGTPNTWTYDSSTGTFQFDYSTEMANGSGSFAAGATTTISTPAVEYPNGYQVSVTGGHVTSAANAPELIIASDNGAKTVSVTVTPVLPSTTG